MFDSEVRISVDNAMPAPTGLRYVCDDRPEIRRRRAGDGFVYLARGFVVEVVQASGAAESTGLRAEEAAVLALLRGS